MPRLEESEIQKYWQIFQGLKPVDNKVTGDKVAPVLKNSRLGDSQLSKIWELSDIDNDGKLDFEEFCITMRLIFDLVNGSIDDVPAELPSWLIPSSKAALIQANKAVNSSNLGIDYDDDDEEGLRDDFDWYISPTDKATYETIYNSNSDSYGRIRFESLNSLYATLQKVPTSDISSAWNLVNPKSFETIDKDQTLVFLHILNQREAGKRIPRGVPASLRATFSKEVPNYDLSAQSQPRQTTSTQASKRSFAESYLNKIGQGSSIRERGTDFSATEGTDWEEVRLRRELADLEKLLDKVQTGAKSEAKEKEDYIL
ncbi:actin cytoskeleton-regulatory complex protein END3, partial [Spathaspora passalidarum NRRL Y-27907]